MGLLDELNDLIDDAAERVEDEDAEKMEWLMKLGRGGVEVVYPSDEPKKEPEIIVRDGIALGGFEMPKGVF